MNGDNTTYPLKYTITLTKEPRLKKKEAKRRIALQLKILDSLKAIGNQSKKSYIIYHSFEISRNTIDSLRVPLFNKGKYSYFLFDNLEKCGSTNLYFKNADDFFEIVNVHKYIFNSHNQIYHPPTWYNEYVPIRYVKNQTYDF